MKSALEPPRIGSGEVVDVDSLPEMAHAVSPDGTILAVSDLWLETLGHRRENVVGQHSTEFLTPRSRAYAIETALPRLERAGFLRNVPFQFLHADGSTVDVQLSARVERDQAGEEVRRVAILKDASELRHANTVSWLTESAVIADDRGEFVRSVIRRLQMEMDVVVGLLVDFQRSEEHWAMGPGDAGTRLGVEELREVRRLARRVQTSRTPEIQESFAADHGPNPFSSCMQQGFRAGVGLPVQRPEQGHGITSVLVLLLNEPRFFTRHERTSLNLAARLVGLVESRQENHRAELRNSELAEVTLSAIQDGVVRVDIEGRIEFVNSAVERLSGQTALELCGTLLRDSLQFESVPELAPIDDAVRHAHLASNGKMTERIVHWVSACGDRAEVELQVRTMFGPEGEPIGDVLTFSDVTRTRALSRELMHQATHDSLSGLINRREFEHQLARTVRHSGQGSTSVLAYLDLDQFKVVNDTCGHAAGDELIRQLAGMIATTVRPEDIVGRLGGDEFGILIQDCSVQDGRRIAERVLEAIGGFRFGWDDKVFSIGASFGLVPIECRSRSAADLLSAADRACYAAKDAGRNRIEVADPNTGSEARPNDMHWIPRVQKALFENRMVLFAQPILSIQRGEAVACEILVRKQAVDGALIPPGAFLGAVERYHIANQLDRWVLEHTLEELGRHRASLDALELVTINLSGQSIGDSVFQEFAIDAVDRSGLPASKIGFEITETAAIANLKSAKQFIEILSERGCRFLLDDFGSGLSSFGYLKDLPVDFVKVDGHFVRNMADDPADFAVVRSIHGIASLTGKQTIAEHVDGGETVELLQALGVQYAQGFGLGEPMPLGDLLSSCERREPGPVESV